MAEMEWEFSEDGTKSDGQFMATGKVINFLRTHLARGEIDQAVALYEGCVQNVGDAVWAEFDGASVPMRKAIANLFFRSRDYARSAAACEKLGEWVAAGRSYEASYDLPRAAACYLKAGNKAKAAAVIEKSGDYRKAAELYYEANDVDASAAALERGGDLVGAAQLFLKNKDQKKAAALLAQVQPSDPLFLQATAVLSDVMIQMTRPDLAAQRLASAVPRGQPIRDNMTAELAYRLGRLMFEMGQSEQARQAFELVYAYNAAYKDVADCLVRAGGRPGAGSSTIPPQGAVPIAPSATGSIRIAQGKPVAPQSTLPAQPGKSSDPFSALDGNPFAPRNNPTGSMPAVRPQPAPGAAVAPGFVTRMEGYETLKKIPIFSELSLDEMKAFFGICEQATYKIGDVIIEQGAQGQGLVIVREGSLKVSKLEGGREVTLATLPAGNFVGEMSLIDEAPTSARVTAAEAVKALRVRRDRFEQFMHANDRIALRVYHAFLRTLAGRLRDTNAQMGAKR
jgi:tetratricopeptide (TPR) repeat protein